MSIVTLDEARRQLGYDDDDTSDDAELQDFVDVLGDVIEDYKHEVIEQRTVTQRQWLYGEDRFWVSPIPVASLTSVVSLDGVTTWTVANMRADPGGEVIVLPGNLLPAGDVVITFQAGYATVPKKYKRGALMILQHVWESQRGAGPGMLTGILGPEEQYDPRLADPVRKAKQLLGPPRPVWA